MKIWLINHYAVPPQYYPLARQNYFARYLMQAGHEVTIFAASTVHNSDLNLIEDNTPYREDVVDGVHYVLIRCKGYRGNGISRILNMLEFARKLPGVCNQFPRPDAIVATSMPPMSCAAGIKLARKYGCRGIAEIADLWPESIVAYGIAGPRNPAVLWMRRLEKWIYTKSDAVVFTMEGAYDYIKEQHWEKAVPESKVHYINNGVDLGLFEYNKEHFRIEDEDLEDPNTFKVIYTGSVRPANNPNLLIDCADKLREYPDIRFLIYGGGENLDELRAECAERQLRNCIFKGPVRKDYIPYILSRSDLNLLNYSHEIAAIYRFGSSQNKLFDYMASGKPILANIKMAHSLLDKYHCGFSDDLKTAEDYAQAVLSVYRLPQEKRLEIGENAHRAAQDYDFKKLTDKLLVVIEHPVADKEE